MYRFLWIFVIALLCLSGAQAMAQSRDSLRKNPDYYKIKNELQYEYQYKAWLARARQYAAKSRAKFPFFTLIEAYTRGPHYDPYGQNTIDLLYKYSFEARSAETSEAMMQAVQNFKDTLDRHMANYTIVLAAVPLVEQNPDLGDVKFLKWMRSGLAQRALGSGTGNVMSSAYEVFSIGEEGLIFSSRRVKLMGTEIMEGGNQYYHIHMTEELGSGKPVKIYVRLTTVMRKVKETTGWRSPMEAGPSSSSSSQVFRPSSTPTTD